MNEDPKKEAERKYFETYGTEYKNDKWTPEDTLKTVAGGLLLLGVSTALVCAFTICTDHGRFNEGGFITTVSLLLGSVVTWSLLRVVAEISTTLKEIKKKL